MGVFPNENATEHEFREPHQRENCAEVGEA